MGANNQWWANNTLEPYRGFRWTIDFKGIGGGAGKIYAMKVDKPSFKIGEYAHKYLNHNFYYPGRVEWNPVTCTIVDVPGGPAATLFAALRSSGYPIASAATNKDGTDGITKKNAVDSFANAGIITITQLMPTGAGTPTGVGTHKNGDSWKLMNAWCQDIKFGSLDYSNEDAVTIDCTIRYDYAMHVPPTVIVGQSIGNIAAVNPVVPGAVA